MTTELFGSKTIIKLPSRRKSTIPTNLIVDTTTTTIKPHQHVKNFIVSEKLYFDRLPQVSVINEHEIMNLVTTCEPLKVHINKNQEYLSGYIQFFSKEMADRAYTLLNGATFRNTDIRLQLKINPPSLYSHEYNSATTTSSSSDGDEPEPHADILHIKNLPLVTNNEMLYKLFRPFGPLNLCTILVEPNSTFKGTALVQYFHQEDAQDAEINMHNKMIQDNIIIVFPVVANNQKSRPNSVNISTPPAAVYSAQQEIDSVRPSTARPDGSNTVDYTNLYIKNLDLNVKSADLFSYFRKYGRIISARVMKNAQTKQSKGFGFVSFSKADEAQKAKQEMNGEYILSKPIIVAFHEPKKSSSPTETHQQQPQLPLPTKKPANGYHQTMNKWHQDPLPLYHPQQYNMERHYSNNNNNMSNDRQQQPHYQTYPHNSLPPLPSQHYTPLKRDLSASSHHHYQQLSALASGALINTPPITTYYQPPPPKVGEIRPTFRRRGSVESLASVMTETTSQTRHHTITKAVMAVEANLSETDIHDISDMLLTMKKKDLATCLFNKVFLKQKIRQAKEALDIFQEQQQTAMPVLSPPIVSESPPANNQKKLADDMDQFLKSIQGLESSAQKQLLGDRLFPLVKATGARRAPAITIRLLDTVPLHQLAHSMYDQDKLKAQVAQVVATISAGY